ncbi:hypothetical protein XBO1_870010 [Xenorhabdus bovienii str. oregonense]|uniref:Uncharacterized protein n=1 Tax=Xenorhabdus bovienii str. oregonense TaxID=1398202 RepID=A0A077PAL0_XENBV|nr:hypothetical protein XBO1_870010 [Xenorhabdus bovienii str. oregonense]
MDSLNNRTQAQTAESCIALSAVTTLPLLLVPIHSCQKVPFVKLMGTPSQFSRADLTRPGCFSVFI